MSEERMFRITHTFKQNYSNWDGGPWDRGVARAFTFDILEKLDLLEKEVYSDRDYTMANDLIDNIKTLK